MGVAPCPSQFLERIDIEEDYILMSEPDHLYLEPIPLLATEGFAAAFPFFYINPKEPRFTPIVQKFNEVSRCKLDPNLKAPGFKSST